MARIRNGGRGQLLVHAPRRRLFAGAAIRDHLKLQAPNVQIKGPRWGGWEQIHRTAGDSKARAVQARGGSRGVMLDATRMMVRYPASTSQGKVAQEGRRDRVGISDWGRRNDWRRCLPLQ